jgi:heme-degrading monooxygenase HmoA
MASFAYVWEYRVPSTNIAAFQAAYGPAGPWVQLFAGQPGYIRTHLLRDTMDPQRFVTIDFWESRQAFDKFLETHREQFLTIDAECEQLTESEQQLGHFYSTEELP